jgi:hypothetical protein
MHSERNCENVKTKAEKELHWTDSKCHKAFAYRLETGACDRFGGASDSYKMEEVFEIPRLLRNW